MKAATIVIVAIIFCFSVVMPACAADEKVEAAKVVPGMAPAAPIAPAMTPAAAGAKPVLGRGMPARPRARSNFAVVFGQVTSVNTADPAKMTLEVKNEADNQVHTIELTPRTTVTKITDISEIKAGETVRVMVRKAEDNKETAMGVSFGKIKNIPMARPVTPAAGAAARPVPAQAAAVPPMEQ